jgi:sortase A
VGAAAVLLVAAGSVLTARGLYLRAKGAVAEALIRRAWAETLRTGRRSPPWPWADTAPVARLLIPAIGYDEIVLEGASPPVLAFGPARMMSSAEPAEPGNVVLAGHRTSFFLPLKDAAAGQDVVLEWRSPRTGALVSRSYRIAELRVIDPADLSFLQPTPGPALTLITCYPFGRGPTSTHRFVVRAWPADARGAGQG